MGNAVIRASIFIQSQLQVDNEQPKKESKKSIFDCIAENNENENWTVGARNPKNEEKKL